MHLFSRDEIRMTSKLKVETGRNSWYVQKLQTCLKAPLISKLYIVHIFIYYLTREESYLPDRNSSNTVIFNMNQSSNNPVLKKKKVSPKALSQLFHSDQEQFTF